jgi:ubiquinone/menaquinone biosynthesis C-methylase UbiE
MSINSYISKQFQNPEGLGGRFVSMIMNRQNRPLYDETIRLLSLADSDSVLDIGCGNGFVMNLLARQYDAQFTGIDTSDSVIKAAIRRNRRFVANNKMRFSCQNASVMSFADGSFSKAYTINTVYFWNDLEGTMAEIRRVLKPGGLFINTLYTNETLARFSHTAFGYKRYAPQQLENAGANLGFTAKAVPIVNGAAYSLIYQQKD